MNAERIRIFPAKYELVCLLLPVVFALFAALELACHWQMSVRQWQLGYFVVTMVFLNHLHIVFTLVFLLCLPEFKSWCKAKRREPGFGLGFGIHVLVISVVIWALGRYGPRFLTHPWMSSLAIVAVYWVEKFHLLAQTKGMGLLYNRELERQLKSDIEASRSIRAVERKERAAFLVMTVFVLAEGSLKVYGTDTLRPIILYVLAGIAFFAALCVIYYSRKYPDSRNSNKPLYMTRVLLYPLLPLSYMAALGVLAAHGVEYTFLSEKIFANSESSQSGVRKTYLTVMVLLLVFGIVALFRFQPSSGLLMHEFPRQNALFLTLVGLSVAFSFQHYYLDRLIFQMKSPVTREHIGPLLLNRGLRAARPSLTKDSGREYHSVIP